MWSCLNHLQKNIAQLITWQFLMIQSVSFTSAAFETFAAAYLCFQYLRQQNKKNLKKYVSENKIYICSRKKSNVSLNKKVIFVFHTIFKLDFITQIFYCMIHRCLFCSFHTIFVLFKKIGIHSMQGWAATTRHGVTRKRSTKRLKHTGNLFTKNLQLISVC